MDMYTLGVNGVLQPACPESVGDLITEIEEGVNVLSKELIEILVVRRRAC